MIPNTTGVKTLRNDGCLQPPPSLWQNLFTFPIPHSTVVLDPQWTDTKKQLTSKPGRPRQIRDMYKSLLTRKKQICGNYFCVIEFHFFYKNSWLFKCPNKISPRRIRFACSNPLVQISRFLLKCLDPMVHRFFWIFKEVKLTCVCSIIKCSRIPAIV